ncbi:Proto-oncogene c-Fos [Trichoplax sp. H2]|nr:Proto-oncogene c-Fos [Trichoplax sp. H2]|eukprot:RDD40307.1 Proto-oncogene c-Fos [Trichoplax sp. H2]
MADHIKLLQLSRRTKWNKGMDNANDSNQRSSKRSRRHSKQLDEDERKKIRREKNKVAAMRCRNRRKKRIETLTKETEVLEKEQGNLKDQISLLQAEKQRLEYLLTAHICMLRKR